MQELVLAVGHVAQKGSEREKFFSEQARALGLLYLPRGEATPREAARILSSNIVILKGMGLTFFDYIELLTAYRGGRFVYSETDNKKFVYLPSGREPKIIACSRKGAPHHARGKNQKRPD